jgi:hypothetical protein
MEAEHNLHVLPLWHRPIHVRGYVRTYKLLTARTAVRLLCTLSILISTGHYMFIIARALDTQAHKVQAY